MQHRRRRKGIANPFNLAIDVLLLSLVFLNLFIYFWLVSRQTPQFHKPQRTWTRIPRDDTRNWSITETYTTEELEMAIEGLHLPTWSRSYVPCNSPQSEVTCDQIVHAWRVVNAWAKNQTEPFESHNHLFIQHYYDGVGNRLGTDAASFVLALMDNRTVSIRGVYPTSIGESVGTSYVPHPAIHIVGKDPNCSEDAYFLRWVKNSFTVWTFHPWYQYRWDPLFKVHRHLLIDYLLYAPMPYLNPDMAAFSYTHFGRHMVYFVSNFISQLPEVAVEAAREALRDVPQNVRVFGVHVRIHIPGEYFAYSVQRTMEAITPFLMHVAQQQPTVFALATDNPEVEGHFRKLFGNLVVTTSAMRRPDADHESAMYDIALLEMCDECLLTYRSTFSYMVMARMGKRAWFFDKESPDVFQVTNSQSTIISTLYHQFDPNDWQPNRRFPLYVESEMTMRKYFQYFML